MRVLLQIFVILLALAAPLRAEDVTVFAAASLAGPLDEIARGWEAETGHSVVISYAGSSALARQVEAGAPADVVILASEDWMDVLETAGRIDPGSRRVLLGNRLVLISHLPHRAPVDLAELPEQLEGGHLALALTEAVPVGIYARAALEHLGLWDRLAPQVVEADNTRAALRLVAIGAARYGIVYATDVFATETATGPRVVPVAEIPADSHPPIRYPVALTIGAGALAEAFSAHLNGSTGRAVLAQAGFILP